MLLWFPSRQLLAECSNRRGCRPRFHRTGCPGNAGF
jgi:hypothetical protein